MSHKKAVVLNKEGNMITVLLDDGSFERISFQQPVEIGMEINIDTSVSSSLVQKFSQSAWKRVVSIAAIFLLVFMGMTGWNMYQVSAAQAMISIDAKASIQLVINRQGKVLSTQSLNDEADSLLEGVSFKGLTWQEAVSRILDRSIDYQYFKEEDSLVLLGYSQLQAKNGQSENKENAINHEVLAREVTDNVVIHGINAHVLAYDLSDDDQAKAKKEGLSLGEYAFLNTANKAGIEINSNDIKESASRSKVIKERVVREQINKDKELGVYSSEIKASKEREQGKEQLDNQSTENKNDLRGNTPPQNRSGLRNNR